MISYKVVLDVDVAEPLNISELTSYSIAYTVGGGGSIDVDVSFDADQANWIRVATALTTGKILTDPAALPTGCLAGYRPLWVRATENAHGAGNHRAVLTGETV